MEMFSQDVTRAKQGGVINDTTAANYYKLHSKYIQRLKPLKRRLTKKYKSQESKKTLANIHKQSLPNMADSLDSKDWIVNIKFIMKALQDEEDNNQGNGES